MSAAGPRTLGVAALAAAVVLAASGPALAYTYAVRARTMAQVYQLRGFRLVGADVLYGRQRFSQSLSLAIDDIGGFSAQRRREHRRGRGPNVSWTSYLRLDHDFGAWTSGSVTSGTQVVDAVDLVPELDESLVALDLLYGYVTVDGLFDDRLTVRIGRQIGFEGGDVWALDGVTATVRPPLPLSIEVMGGLRVRDTSPIAPARVELDGTSGVDCQEYVEGPTPGSGHWRLIDRSSIVENRPLAADRSLCPQRGEWMPTVGVAVATRRTGPVSARVAYRRTESATVGVIDIVDRLQFPDVGLYPDEAGQAPDRAVNAEHVAATVGARLRAGPLRIAPWAWTRASLVQHRVDRAAIGAELRLGAHVITPEVSYRLPSFDSDSIWSIFAVEPTTDVRLGWSGYGADATAWLRRYHGADSDANAYGVEAAGERDLARRWTARMSVLADGGYGGTRFGATAAARYTGEEHVTLTATLAGWRLAPDGDGTWWEGIAQGRATWVFDDRYALHGVVETTASRYTPGQVRFLGVLDLAFEPEL
jgi:hypothetical protein